MTDTDRDTYLASLTPGADIDHRGTPITEDLLDRLLNAVRDPTTTHPHLGTAQFDEAQFSGSAQFDEAQFSGTAQFDGAQFSGDAWFSQARFSGDAWFSQARFSDTTGFEGARFSGRVWFDGAHFSDTAHFSQARFSGKVLFGEARFSGDAVFGQVWFSDVADFGEARFSGNAVFGQARFSDVARFTQAQFSGNAWFAWARFSGVALFDEAQFSDDALFDEAQFSDAQFGGARFSDDTQFGGARFSGDAQFGAQFLVASRWGPVVCTGMVDLSGAVFGAPVTLEVTAEQVLCTRTRWQSTATVRVRHASVDLGHAVLEAPLAVTAHPTPFTTAFGQILDESTFPGSGAVRVVSVQGVDAAHLVLTDTDLSDCLFSGAFHLDQLRLEGRTTLASTPTGWHLKGIAPVRWTRRRTLAEEQHWRARTAGQSPTPIGAPPEPRRWRTGPHHPDPARTPDPDDVAPLYRQLRKAFEDGKNEPGAADFYYGECEMRRHDHTGTPKAERRLLWAYWLLSGYGLRAGRTLGWLAAAMLATIVLLMAFGLPVSSPKQEATGTVPAGGGTVTFIIDKPDVKNPTRDRFTSRRFDKALNVTLNSVVFRSSGQDLTTTGTYIEMTSRILEPGLLALAVLAVRGRIKR
ncbi:pentapeptide repeat-containing protein [Streptomyces sp. NRRL S-87]|uniref:pentapeptide repeat-containing protein n=1 Tax=Streptomyces sp. NRRL S-87 TaxID=1463920 RepID=UPI002D21D6C9|nr:pentapeptide repeat-containing protein [Streptomyces sp. NRRL S-87]